jgi:hypothetical protein
MEHRAHGRNVKPALKAYSRRVSVKNVRVAAARLAAIRTCRAEFGNLNRSKEARMSDWPKDEEGVLFFRTRQVAEAAAAKCNAAKLDPGVKWRVLEKDGKFYVAAFISRDVYDVL